MNFGMKELDTFTEEGEFIKLLRKRRDGSSGNRA